MAQMNANPWTQVSLPVTLDQLLDGRAEALRLLSDARRITDMAKQGLDQLGSYLMPHSAQLRESHEQVTRELDRAMWRRAFDLTGFKQLMDAEAVADFERSLHPAPPEFTDANIRATFIDLHQKSGAMFRRGIVNVFRYLSDDYKTNAKEPFKVGRKVIMGWMIGPSFQRGLQIRIGSGDKINDIDRIIRTLDGKQFKPREVEYAMNAAFTDGKIYECDYYRAKAFQNGNLHLEFKRADLLDGLNDQIAEHYADGALAYQRH